jgi:hypothetical protein
MSSPPNPRSVLTILALAWVLCVPTACLQPGAPAQPGTEPQLLVPPSSGDADLDELRRLALVAPAQELRDRHLQFMVERDRNYRADPYLWHGIRRLCLLVPGMPDGTDRRMLAKLLIQTIEHQKPPPELELARELDRLRVYAR